MRIQLISAVAAALLLAACSSDGENTGNAAGTNTSGTDGQVAAASVAPGSAEDFKQNVGDRVFFALDRYDVSAEAQQQLQKQAAWLQQYPAVTVTVEGHADERGTREYNLALGERRANSVANYLTALGVDKSRLSVISYGKERPECTESNEACWSQNRRAVTTINR
ncbi:peptidoglycan-associated lipoprotein Pal [Dongia soli]|uniref:Peptidoglycan-associated lipoprotein n=1 Tax=Dongia soli TaxID=600628 RepID=A0ABU5EAK1_9PROT|nr:peptidoglycan-associated lipoprotein Pal [Dongia soli]MDY0883378.1 peptidoglycan-associated lipoprotein Pal [Dongia soli]